jgi:hypothetical protein
MRLASVSQILREEWEDAFMGWRVHGLWQVATGF